MTTLKQHCSAYGFLLFVLLEVGIFILLLRMTNLLGGLVWLVLWPVLLWVFLHSFSRFARFVGYNLVDDVPPAVQHQTPTLMPTRVRLYTNLACPFCPLVKSRLHALREHMNFELEIVDVSLRPDILLTKSIMAVPVVEVGQDRLIGNSTSRQLAQFIEQHDTFAEMIACLKEKM